MKHQSQLEPMRVPTFHTGSKEWSLGRLSSASASGFASKVQPLPLFLKPLALPFPLPLPIPLPLPLPFWKPLLLLFLPCQWKSKNTIIRINIRELRGELLSSSIHSSVENRPASMSLRSTSEFESLEELPLSQNCSSPKEVLHTRSRACLLLSCLLGPGLDESLD